VTRKILVTGACGFIGRYASKQFADAGYLVTGIGHGEWDKGEAARFGVSCWHSCDVNMESMAAYAGQPDAIVHCAGGGSVQFSMEHPALDFERTVSSTLAVLEYVRSRSHASVVVYPSSAAVYGMKDDLPNRESDSLVPTSPYGAHKVMGEQLCRSYATNFGLNVAIVRLFSVYGEGLRKQLMWDSCSRFDQGDTRFAGSGRELRDWLHVKDAARLLSIAVEHGAPTCPTVNGGSGIGVEVADLIALLRDAYGVDTPLRFSGEVRSGDPQGYQASIAKAKAWGWSPSIDLETGVRDYATWFRGLR